VIRDAISSAACLALQPSPPVGLHSLVHCSRLLRPIGHPGETYWRLVKRQLPLQDGLIYLNAANICPASRPVLDRHLELLRDFHSNPAFQNRDKYKPRYESLRTTLV
jgi:hypothetical protein